MLQLQGGQSLTFSGEGSRDPDDRAGRTPLRYSWSCTKTDAAAKASADVPAAAKQSHSAAPLLGLLHCLLR